MSARYDASAELAAERPEPMTADEHAGENGLRMELARDRPASCTCPYRWFGPLSAYKMIALASGCPWHTGAQAHRAG